MKFLSINTAAFLLLVTVCHEVIEGAMFLPGVPASTCAADQPSCTEAGPTFVVSAEAATLPDNNAEAAVVNVTLYYPSTRVIELYQLGRYGRQRPLDSIAHELHYPLQVTLTGDEHAATLVAFSHNLTEDALHFHGVLRGANSTAISSVTASGHRRLLQASPEAEATTAVLSAASIVDGLEAVYYGVDIIKMLTGWNTQGNSQKLMAEQMSELLSTVDNIYSVVTSLEVWSSGIEQETTVYNAMTYMGDQWTAMQDNDCLTDSSSSFCQGNFVDNALSSSGTNGVFIQWCNAHAALMGLQPGECETYYTAEDPYFSTYLALLESSYQSLPQSVAFIALASLYNMENSFVQGLQMMTYALNITTNANYAPPASPPTDTQGDEGWYIVAGMIGNMSAGIQQEVNVALSLVAQAVDANPIYALYRNYSTSAPYATIINSNKNDDAEYYVQTSAILASNGQVLTNIGLVPNGGTIQLSCQFQSFQNIEGTFTLPSFKTQSANITNQPTSGTSSKFYSSSNDLTFFLGTPVILPTGYVAIGANFYVYPSSAIPSVMSTSSLQENILSIQSVTIIGLELYGAPYQTANSDTPLSIDYNNVQSFVASLPSGAAAYGLENPVVVENLDGGQSAAQQGAFYDSDGLAHYYTEDISLCDADCQFCPDGWTTTNCPTFSDYGVDYFLVQPTEITGLYIDQPALEAMTPGFMIGAGLYRTQNRLGVQIISMPQLLPSS